MAGVYNATRWSSVPPEVMKNLLNATKELFAGCTTILDVGIGTGRFAEYLRNWGVDVVGIDVSLSMTAKPGEKGDRNLVPADDHYLPSRRRDIEHRIMAAAFPLA